MNDNIELACFINYIMRTYIKSFVFVLLCFMHMSFCSSHSDVSVEEILRKHVITFTEPPKRIPSQHSVDAPLLGNGYTGVALSGTSDNFVFRFARNDFWRLKSSYGDSYPLVLGKVVLSMPQLKDASYEIRQRLYDAVTSAHFKKEDRSVTCDIYMPATKDIMVVEIFNNGKEHIDGSLKLFLPGKEEIRENPPHELVFPDERESGTVNGNIQYISRAYDDSVDIKTKASAAMRVYGGQDGVFSLGPNKSLMMICAFSSNFKSDDCLRSVISEVEAYNKKKVAKLRKTHVEWWKKFWEKSYVSIPDSVIELQYYRSLYGIACCSRDKNFPPSIFGTWITKEQPWWFGDYHLNYNHMAPYYGLYSANRLEQALPYYAPLIDAIPMGKRYSEEIAGIEDGIILPVGIGPLGIETTRQSAYIEKYKSGWIKSKNVEAGGLFWGQKSNSAYAVVNMSMHFYRTWDKNFARMVYPFVKGVATFWEKYLKLDGDRYIILNDAIHEGTVGTMNPILSLGLVRMVFKTVCDMSEFLGFDQEKRNVWKDKCEKLADYQLQKRNGKTVFRYTEKGTDWWHNNTLGIQHIYPAGQIGLASESELLDVALNNIEEMRRWYDFNGSNSFYPAAVRVGYSADSILTHLHNYSLKTYPNGFQYGNPHGIENFSTVPNTINEMLCMGHQDVIRVFPVWPHTEDAFFRNIRVEGAFLVSSSIKDGQIDKITILSEKGRDLNLQNPWNETVEVKVSGGRKLIVDGDFIRMKTEAGKTYTFRPIK